MIAFGILLLCAGNSLAQSYVCQEDGFYRDPNQCDKYYDCYRGNMKEVMCPDGLVFDNSLAPKLAQCNYPFLSNCPEGSVLQPAQPSGIECPRQNGYFEHEDPANCAAYYECSNGLAVRRDCHGDLVFDEYSGTCQWAKTELRTGCGIRVNVLEDGFSCPNETQVHTNGHVMHHTRFLHKNDCRSFYVCSEGKYPSHSGCPEGTVFNDLSLNCDDPANVSGCENYYDQV